MRNGFSPWTSSRSAISSKTAAICALPIVRFSMLARSRTSGSRPQFACPLGLHDADHRVEFLAQRLQHIVECDDADQRAIGTRYRQAAYPPLTHPGQRIEQVIVLLDDGGLLCHHVARGQRVRVEPERNHL